jgi:hypothetical protein
VKVRNLDAVSGAELYRAIGAIVSSPPESGTCRANNTVTRSNMDDGA